MLAKSRQEAKEYEGADAIPGWMVEALDANGDDRYLCWGNYEDYMGSGEGWASPQEVASPSELWELDDLNELANFYFMAYREARTCPDCEGYGYNEETRRLLDTWSAVGGWEGGLTQDEVDALFDAGCIAGEEAPAAEEFNAGEPFLDAMACHVCVRARATRLGVYGHCPTCEGEGALTLDSKWRLGLQMWFLHPRKGASRGLVCTDVSEDELPWVYAYLRQARDRMAAVFAAVPKG